MAETKTEAQLRSADVAGRLDASWKSYIEQEEAREPSNQPYTYASDWHPCARYHALKLTRGETAPKWDVEALARFRRGRDRERDILTDLARVGRICDPPFEKVGGQERFELRDRKGRVAIVGKVDVRLRFEGDRSKIPAEIKSWSPFLTDRIRCFEDLLDSPWTRRGAYQLVCYMLGAGEERGLLILDRPGIPLFIPVDLWPNLDRAEKFLLRAEAALDAVESGELPPFLAGDPAECKRCPFFGAACNPPLDHGAGAKVLADPEFEALLERREELAEAASEFQSLDKEAKARLRGVEMGVCGPFFVTGKWGKSTRYDLPAEVEDKYRVIDPKGRFTLKIKKVG